MTEEGLQLGMAPLSPGRGSPAGARTSASSARTSRGRRGGRRPGPQGPLVRLSALLTAAMAMFKTLDALTRAGLRDWVHVLVGGAPVTAEFAERVGADGYAPDAKSGATDQASGGGGERRSERVAAEGAPPWLS
jgi:hypothetical protein